MHIEIADGQNAPRNQANLQQETDGLALLSRSWTQHVAAWQLAHEAAIANAQSVLARMDALIAKLDAR